MPSLPVLSGKAACKVLADHGFNQVRQRGSHIIMQKSPSGTTITVPVPHHKERRIGALRSIIRQSGLTIEDFIA